VYFTVSGTGSTTGVATLVGGTTPFQNDLGTTITARAGRNGKVTYILIRQDAGGGATSCDYKMIDNQLATNTAYASIKDEYIVSEGSSIALTASATDASLNSPIDARPTFQSNLAIVFNVTAVGAWTLTGFVTLEF